MITGREVAFMAWTLLALIAVIAVGELVDWGAALVVALSYALLAYLWDRPVGR